MTWKSALVTDQVRKVPAHVWIEGNEKADRMAKASLGRDKLDVQVTFLWIE